VEVFFITDMRHLGAALPSACCWTLIAGLRAEAGQAADAIAARHRSLALNRIQATNGIILLPDIHSPP
jgi:hypothetical protein